MKSLLKIIFAYNLHLFHTNLLWFKDDYWNWTPRIREKKQFTTIKVGEGFTEIMYWNFAT